MSQGCYCYDYPHPALSADCIIWRSFNEELHVLLIRRKYNPYKDMWAFPGGFVEEGEQVEEAAKRELFEETGLSGIFLEQLHTFSKPGRDPRGWTVSVAFTGFDKSNHTVIKAGDDAGAVQWFPLSNLPGLAFDHQEMLELALLKLKEKK